MDEKLIIKKDKEQKKIVISLQSDNSIKCEIGITDDDTFLGYNGNTLFLKRMFMRPNVILINEGKYSITTSNYYDDETKELIIF